MTSDRTRLLIIRAWIEPGSAKPLRAHIRQTSDVSAGIEQELTLADIADVSAFVASWLDEAYTHELPPEPWCVAP